MNDVKQKLNDMKLTPQIVNSVYSVMSNPTPFEDACSNVLATERDLNKYVESNFPYVDPVQYVFGHDGGQQDSIQYISILDTLQQLLQNDEIFSAVIHSHQSNDGMLRDLCDGSYFRQHPVFCTDQQPTLQIVLYYDDFSAVNPLGHRAKQYKIASFYFMLANLEPKYRSCLHTLNLVALCFATAVKKYGFENLLAPLISDLQTLATTGVSVVRSDGTFTFRGSLLLVVADNLAAHSLGGYLESFSTIHPCRFCLVSRDKLCSTLTCEQSYIRTPESYDRQVQRVLTDRSFQSVYGLKSNSCLNNVPHFHVTQAMPSDVMHDMLEGVLCDVVECVVGHFIAAGIITLDYVNAQIDNFPYHGCDKQNRPDVVPPGNFRCRQTAAKNRCFLRLLPAMIGNRIPVADCKWEVLLLLLDVHDAVMSPVMSKADTMILDDKVQSFIESFCNEFPDESFKPKMHYLLHYGNHCRSFGPMINYWSFRFEGKHSYFKDIANRMKCRKNILKSLAKKHQYKHSWHLQSTAYLCQDHMTITGGKEARFLGLSDNVQTALCHIVHGEFVFQVTSADVDGIVYSCGSAVVTGVYDDDICFSVINDLFIINGSLYLVVCKLKQQEYWRHFHLYSAHPSTDLCALCVPDLVDPFPLPVYRSEDSALCIILKHSISLDQ